jgi:hypothetical protein
VRSSTLGAETKLTPLNPGRYRSIVSSTSPVDPTRGHGREKDGDVPGGIAFIRQNPERGPTLGRIYLITDEQFNDVVLQENTKKPGGNRYVPPFEQLVSQPELPLDDDPLYGKILNIGSEEGRPILTFTTGRCLTLNEPSENYLKEIAAGIKETYPQMGDDNITQYLLRADGVRGKIDLAKIKDWVTVA